MAQTLTFNWANATPLAWGAIVIQDATGTPDSPVNSCYLWATSNGAAAFFDDTGSNLTYDWLGSSPTVLSNTHCQLNGPASSAIVVSNGGASIQAALNLQFNQAWAGKTLTIWMKTVDAGYANGNWKNAGTFTVAGTGTPTFTMSATDATALQGTTGVSTITVTGAGSSAVTLSQAGTWPAGITAAFTPNPETGGTASAVISVASTVAATELNNPIRLTVNGVSSAGGAAASTTIALTVNTPTLPYGVSATAAAGSGTTENVTLNWASPAGQLGLAWGSVIIQDASASTAGTANGCYLWVEATGAVVLFDDTGTAGSLNVWPPNSWAISPNNSQCQLNGPQSGAVSVTNGGSNIGVTLNLQFFASKWPAGKTLAVWMQGTNTGYQSGTWQQVGVFTVPGAAGGGGTSPSFTMAAAAATVHAGATGYSTVGITGSNGFNAAVTLAASGWPAGITAVYGVNPVTGSSGVVGINVASTVAAGSYTLTLNGTAGALSASTTIALTVTALGTLPYAVSVMPVAGTGAAGVAQDLTLGWADPPGAGQAGLAWGSVVIQDATWAAPAAAVGASAGPYAGACYLRVIPNGNVQLFDDAGATSYPNSGVGNSWATSPENSQCKLNGPASSVLTVDSGSFNMSVRLNLVFKSAWAGKTLAVWMMGTDLNYQSSPGWVRMGTFVVTP